MGNAGTAQINRSRPLGVEHEFAIPMIGRSTPSEVQALIAQILTANGLSAISRPYCHDPIDQQYVLAVERDGSIQGEQRYAGVTWVPIEIKTRPLSGYDEWEAIVPKMLAICAYLGGRATRSCGYHVHLALREFIDRPVVARSLFNLFHRFEPVIYRLLPPSRTNNRYCQPLPEQSGLLTPCKTGEFLGTALSKTGTRYSGLNLTHLHDPAGPHVELRYAAGTLDVEKARHWLRFCLQMVQHAVTRTCHAGERVKATRGGLDRLFTCVGLKVNSRLYTTVAAELRETARFLLRRWHRFSDQTTLSAETDDSTSDRQVA